MKSNESFEVTYTNNNILYSVVGDNKLHFRLQNDPNFCQSYLEETQDSNEITGIIETVESQEFHWTRPAILLLINSYEERKARFRNPKIKNKNLWTEIKTVFLEKGYSGVTEDALDRKLRNMKKTYKTIKDNKGKKTSGRGHVNWEYFEAFEQLFVEDKTVNVEHSLSSMATECESTSVVGLCVPGPSQSGTCSLNVNAPTPLNLLSLDLEDESPLPSSAPGSTPCVSPGPLNNFIPASTPSTSSLKLKSSTISKKEKAARGKLLYVLRKNQLEIEADRVQELKKLRETIELSNRIQEQRNKLLEQLLLNRNSQ